MLSFLLFHRRTQILAVGLEVSGAISIFVVGTVPYAIHNRIWYRPDMAAAPLSLQKFTLYGGISETSISSTSFP